MGKAADEALIEAAKKGDEAAVRAALDKGANVNVLDDVRPLHARCFMCRLTTSDAAAPPPLPALRRASAVRQPAAAQRRKRGQRGRLRLAVGARR